MAVSRDIMDSALPRCHSIPGPWVMGMKKQTIVYSKPLAAAESTPAPAQFLFVSLNFTIQMLVPLNPSHTHIYHSE